MLGECARTGSDGTDAAIRRHQPGIAGAIRVAGKLVQKCPLMARWLVTRHMRRSLLYHIVHSYRIEKKQVFDI
jgi:hypothetical protein